MIPRILSRSTRVWDINMYLFVTECGILLQPGIEGYLEISTDSDRVHYGGSGEVVFLSAHVF